MSLLEVNDLTVTYLGRGRRRHEVTAVDGVSLSVERGELLALVGESGSGKTSTAQAILRIVEPTNGTVTLDGDSVGELNPKALRRMRRRIQAIYQDPYESLNPRLTVAATIEEPLLIHALIADGHARRLKVCESLERAGLTPPETYLGRYPHELSGGQRQRVAIAASLVLNPEILIADEPVSMLDVSVRIGVLKVLDGLRRENGMSILMITHDLSTAAAFADRVAVMYRGRIVELGSARAVVDHPRHPYTRALLAALPERGGPGGEIHPVAAQDEAVGELSSGCRFAPRCRFAVTECRQQDPTLDAWRSQSGAEHRAACLRVESLPT
jgi:oligopeptide/dipeptide ABC transporter ATP-binding protein